MKLIKYIILAVLPVFVAACSGNDEPEPDPYAPMMTLVYMVSDNSLGSSFQSDEGNLEQMRTAVFRGALNGGGRLLVYRDGPEGNPTLFEITANGDMAIADYTNDISSLTVDRMQRVINDARAAVPAHNYGLVLWSHGTGWIESSAARSADGTTAVEAVGQSFGQDQHPVNTEMKIATLAEALRSTPHEFIYFDCCFMASVEVLYELRNCAKTFIAYATEIPIEGMPYDVNTKLLVAGEVDGVQMAKNTLDYYQNRASNPSCAIAVVDAAALDNLATATRAVMQTGVVASSTYYGVPFFRSGGPRTYLYDMKDYIKSLEVDATLLASWQQAYDKAVVYSGATAYSYGLDMSKYSGLGCHIVRTAADATILGYRNQSWWSDVVNYNPSVSQ